MAKIDSVPRMRALNFGVVVAIARRPRLWLTAVRQALRMRPRVRVAGGDSYLGFRMQTQYGSDVGTVAARDVVSYLEWCREWNAAVRPDRRVSLTRRRPGRH